MRNAENNTCDVQYEYLTVTENDKDHFHDKVEIFLVVEGRIKLNFKTPVKNYEIFKGDIAVIKNAEYHALYPVTKAVLERLYFPANLGAIGGKPFVYQSFVLPSEAIESDELIKNTVRNFFDLIKRDKERAEDTGISKSLCGSLFTLLLSMYDKRSLISCVGEKALNVNGKKKLSYDMLTKFENILHYISNNYCDASISLSSLSSLYQINKTNLSDVFPKLTGQKFTERLHQLRVNHAIELMCNTCKNISEIAYASGFETIRSFNNVFKKITGVTPSAYLSSLNGNSKEISTSIEGVGKNIFDYKWRCNANDGLDFKFLHDENCIKVLCLDTENRRWTHLRLFMIFFPGKRYKVTYKAKLLTDSRGNEASGEDVGCTIAFNDFVTNYPYHHPEFFEKKVLEDGWKEYTAYFTVPDYYVQSSQSSFSIYSNPSGDYGTNYLLKDVQMKRIKSEVNKIEE